MAPLNSPKEKLSEQRIKTLTNAARISCHVKGPTIGPNALVDPPEPEPAAAEATGAIAAQKPDPKTGSASKNRWRYDAWRPVKTADNADDDDDDEYGGNPHWRPTPTSLTLADCRAVRFSMALKSAEKVQRQIVRQKQAERQSQYDEMIAKLDKFRIDSTAKALSAVRAATLAKEERILAAAREFDEQARVAAEQQQRENAEHRRRALERTERLRRDEEIRGHFEAIKSSKNLFIVVFEKLVRTNLQNQQTLPNFNTYSARQSEFLQRYEQLLATVNQGQISAAEVEQLEQLCEEMQTLQRTIDEEVNESGERLTKMMAEQAAAEAQRRQLEAETAAAAQLKLEQEQQQEQELKRQQNEQQQQQQQQQQQPAFIQSTAADDAVDTPVVPAATPSAQFVHPDRLAMHTDVLEFYEQYKRSVKPLQADDAMKSYRFNCQKAVNIPLNSISAVNPQHLIDKLDKLCALLSGGAVQVGTLSVSAAAHPLGVRFCSLLAAKKLVQQADSMISTDSMHAYPIAAIIVAAWQRFPDLGKLCLAYLYKESPYLVPYFMPQKAGQSSEDFLQSLGYRFVDGQVESNELYLKRQTGMVRLYAAIVVAQPRRGQTAADHPHGISNGWVFLSHFINLEPLPDICATLLYEFLVVAGCDLWRMYGQQFHKLLVVLYQQYLVVLSKVDKGGPRARLEQLLARVLQERRFEEPEGRLMANFW